MNEMVNVRYMVTDVEASIAWYQRHLAFELISNNAPAFADVKRGALRLLLSGPKSSAGRPMPDGETPSAGGWNRIHFIVDDIDAQYRQAAQQERQNGAVDGAGQGSRDADGIPV